MQFGLAYFSETRLDEVELSQVPHKYSSSVTMSAQAVCVKKMVAVGRSRHLQMELKLNCRLEVERLKVKEMDSRCNAYGQ